MARAISTCPKDGTVFQAWFPESREWHTVLWDTPEYGNCKTFCIDAADRKPSAAVFGEPTRWLVLQSPDADEQCPCSRPSGCLNRDDCQINRSQTMTVTDGPDLASVLRIIDSCGGSKMPGESDDHHAGYNAALDAVEREMKRAWARISEAQA